MNKLAKFIKQNDEPLCSIAMLLHCYEPWSIIAFIDTNTVTKTGFVVLVFSLMVCYFFRTVIGTILTSILLWTLCFCVSAEDTTILITEIFIFTASSLYWLFSKHGFKKLLNESIERKRKDD